MAEGTGYNAGSIYVDFSVVNADASKELDRLEKKLKTLGQREKDLDIQRKALQKSYLESVKLYGENSKEAEKLSKKLKNLSSKEAELRTHIEGVKDAIQNQSRYIYESAGSTEDLADSLEKSNKRLKGMKNSAEEASVGVNTLHTAFTALKAVMLSVAAQKLWEGLIIPNAELESSIASFEVLLGSYEKAQKLTSELEKLGAETPLTSTDLIGNAKQLLATGTSLEDIVDVLRTLGDLSMGSAEKLERLTNAFGKIQTSGKGSLEYLNYFSEAGVPIIEALAEQLNVSKEEFFELTQAGKVSAAQVNSALRSMTEEGGRFYNMMEKQSQTFNGLASTLEDNLQIIARGIGEETFNELKGYIQGIIDEIERLEKTGELDKIIKDWGGAIADLVKLIGSILKTLYDFRDAIGVVVIGLGGLTVANKASKTITTLASSASAAGVAMTALGGAMFYLVGQINEAVSSGEAMASEYRDLVDANNELSRSYKSEVAELDRMEKLTNEYLQTVKELSGKVNLSAEEHEALKSSISGLNELYPNLNLAYDVEHSALSRNITDVENYTEAYEKMQKLMLKSNMGDMIQKQLDEMASMSKVAEARLKSIEDELKYNTNLTQAQRIALAAEGEELSSSLYAMGIQMEPMIGVLAEIRVEENALKDKLEETTKVIEDQEAAWAQADKTFSDVIGEMRTEIDALSESNRTLSESINDNIDEISDLTDILSQEGKQIKLTKDETLNLLDTYPELASVVKEVNGVFTIERDELELLRQAKIEEAQANIDSQIAATEQTIQSVKDRMSAYNEEIAQISTLAQAQAALADATERYNKRQEENSRKLSELQSGELNPADITNISSSAGVAEAIKEEVEVYSELTELFGILDNLTNESQANMKKIEVAATKTGDAISRATSATSSETEDEKLIRNLKYRLDMEEISYQKYYDTLEVIKDKFYADGTKQWQQYTLEISKGRKKLEEENKAAELKSFEDYLSKSYEDIEDQQFYGKIDDEGIISGYEKIREYTKKYYRDGKIDYERYLEEIKKIDKEIYSIQKENLQTSMDELSDYRKKKYDEAVSQVEAYYDELERAEDEYERRQELGELEAQAALYEGAITKTGKQRYKDIQDDINELLREEQRIERETEKEDKLKQLEETYNQLENSQIAYFDSIIGYSEEATLKIQEMTQMVQQAFGNISGILSSVPNVNNHSITNNKTLIQNNTITDRAAGQAVVDLTAIKYRYSL